MSHLKKNQMANLELPELKLVENRLREVVAGRSPLIRDMTHYILDLGGKRIRPLLVLLTSDIYRANLKVRVEVATAAELIHTASLLHDDVVDEAPIRRGKETVNVRWGNPQSVLAGDFIFARSFEMLSKYSRVLEIMTAAIAAMCEGELVQLDAHFDPDISPENYVTTIAGKTASLLAASCECGGLISSMPQPQVVRMRNFGLHLGIAYQIIDDIGDYVLGDKEAGKAQGTDIKHGIVTLPLLYLLADDEIKSRLQYKFEHKQNLTPEELAQDLAKTQALKRSAEVACRHIDLALEQLQGMPRVSSVMMLERLAREFKIRCQQFN